MSDSEIKFIDKMGSTTVALEGRVVGFIVATKQGWQYQPKGASKRNYGTAMQSLESVKQSLL